MTQGALLSHWSFEDTGSIVTDGTGGRTGQLSPAGASFSTLGISGRGLSLREDLGGYVNLGNVLPLTNAPFTIVAWIKTAPDNRTSSLFLGKHSSGNGHIFFVNRTGNIGQNDKVSFFAASGNVLTSTTSVNNGLWHQVAVTYQASGAAQLFVDGNLEDSDQLPAMSFAATSFFFGGYSPNPPPATNVVSTFTGEMDEVQIYDRALAAIEIDLLYLEPTTHLETPVPGVLEIAPPGRDFTNTVHFGFINTLPIGSVRYTLDGSEPTAQSTLFENPVVLSTGVVQVKARIFINGFPVTETVSTTFRRIYPLLGDGITAAWREQYFGPDYAIDPRVAATADPDNDGITNLQEFVAGTDPLNPLSGLSLNQKLVPGISWASVPNTRYRVMHRSSLADGNWTALGEIVATGTNTTFAHHQVSSSSAFYRVDVVPQ